MDYTRKYKKLTKKERTELFNKYINENDINARNELLKTVLPYVKSLVFRDYYINDIQTEDDTQNAIEYGLNYISNYNPDYSLTTFFKFQVKNYFSNKNRTKQQKQIKNESYFNEETEELSRLKADNEAYRELVDNYVDEELIEKIKRKKDSKGKRYSLDFINGKTLAEIAWRYDTEYHLVRISIVQFFKTIK